ncbi:DMT family transporter [Streptococcus equi]|nr:DMT family transporter [Streptococcus equi]MCD3384782.1 DMT family transporter [Streptococcus equi subsp. zooepidemicus]MCD3393160.1 DMT family transporter [Streptococcus equi subsp. zooepidemicus]QTR95232.1 putative inner membrane transporter YicL [Streptococcus equi subsp. zooepidemicus]HEL0664619.1 EamA family transporter [Streptococcus equi subsp. zooepidemicus]HEL0688326.1 EamA family transporter [Streptococcus equi subsp. zooepidemicus]
MSRNGKGSTMILLAGIAWGLSGVSGQYLIAHGVGINALTSLRLIISGLVLSSMAYMRQRDAVIRLLKDKRLLRELLIYSLFGLTLNQYAYLLAIRYSNAGTATVLQYLSPILVLVYLSFKSRRLPAAGESCAICLAILGMVIMACHGDLSHLAINPIGLFWGLFAAVTYAYCVIKPAKLIADWGSLLIVGLAMLMGGVIFPILTRAWQYPLAMTYGNLRALFGIIGIGTIFAYTFFLKGASIIGPIKATLLASIEPVASVFFAIILMKETFHPIDLLGMALILIAVLVISLRDLLLAQRKKQLALKAKRLPSSD